MTVARTATAAAVAGLVAVAAWSAFLGPKGSERFAVGGSVRGAAADYRWQQAATRADLVPDSVLRAASGIRIAIVDTGADVATPAIAARNPSSYDVRTGTSSVSDPNGHGTFVAS